MEEFDHHPHRDSYSDTLRAMSEADRDTPEDQYREVNIPDSKFRIRVIEVEPLHTPGGPIVLTGRVTSTETDEVLAENGVIIVSRKAPPQLVDLSDLNEQLPT